MVVKYEIVEPYPGKVYHASNLTYVTNVCHTYKLLTRQSLTITNHVGNELS